MGEGYISVVEHLSHKYLTQNSIPTTANNDDDDDKKKCKGKDENRENFIN